MFDSDPLSMKYFLVGIKRIIIIFIVCRCDNE